MKASRFIILRKHRDSAEQAKKPLSFLGGMGLTLLALALLAAVGIGINYALFCPRRRDFAFHTGV